MKTTERIVEFLALLIFAKLMFGNIGVALAFGVTFWVWVMNGCRPLVEDRAEKRELHE